MSSIFIPGVPLTRSITTTADLTGGGDLSANRQIGLADPVDDPSGDYVINNITYTVDRKGRVTKTVGKKGNHVKVADLPNVFKSTGAANDLVLTDGDSGLYFDSGAFSAADNWKIACQAAPSDAASWQVVAHIQAQLVSLNYDMFGMALYENDATGRVLIFGPAQNGGLLLYYRRMTKAGFTADSVLMNCGFAGSPMWLRVRYNLPDTKYYFDYGLDGVNWVNIGSILKATAFAVRADNVGLGFWLNNGTATLRVPALCDYLKVN